MISRCGRVALVGALAATLTGAAACGYGTANPQPAYPAPQSAGQVKGAPVAVTLAEYNINLAKSTLSPGTYTFVLKNVGKVTHSLAISGPGVDQTSGLVNSGGTTTLTVTLEPGTYDVWCPVDDHRGMGMETNLTVK